MSETILTGDIIRKTETAIQKRAGLFDDPQTDAFRLFNGFYEGCPFYSIDRYGDTAVILWMNKAARPAPDDLEKLSCVCLDRVPGIRTILLKDRFAADPSAKTGRVLSGDAPASRIREWGILYGIDLCLNKDCGFYLDSALLRKWLSENARGKRVLNTFAYTGSLGDAAEAGGAAQVTQTDLNRNYLREQHSTQEYISGDFFQVTSRLRHSGRLFDLIILDPPLYARTPRGAKVDMLHRSAALINKIRPLAAHKAKIVVINNALFLSGEEFLTEIQTLCGPYLSVSETIPVPDSFFGYGPVSAASLPADPAPFNHTTKILVLDAARKDGRE